jgi:hypothetical protein
LLPVNAIAHQGPDAVIAVENLGVYPNGFTVNVRVLMNPHSQNDIGASLRARAGHWPRIGVRFSDGRSGGRSPRLRGLLAGLAKDEQGLPTEPFVNFVGGVGGGSAGWQFRAWVYPLPPEGPVEIFVQVPTMDESSVTVDGLAVRRAAERAIVIWS